MDHRATALRLLGHPSVTRGAIRATRRRLRILAYHAVPSRPRFEEHLRFLTSHMRPVSGAEVVQSIVARTPLPDVPVWVTFDDGDPSVIDQALPLLASHGVPATIFVCPGLLDTDQPYWWHVVEAAIEAGVAVPASPAGPLATLKRLTDEERRARVDELGDRVRNLDPSLLKRPQLTTAALERWVAAGQEVGNHTWDHPLLDRCRPEEQREQVRRAHERLRALLGSPPTLFAYPNGNWSPPVEMELHRLGYRAGVGFDHRIATTRDHPLRLSRLRVDADASVDRLRSIVSGVHPAGLAVRRAITDREGVRSDPRRLP